MRNGDVEAVSKFLKDTIDTSGLNLTFVAVHKPGDTPSLTISFSGPDITALLYRHGELLLALEHLATQILRLTPEQHDHLSFDAGNFKAQRDRDLESAAAQAITEVRSKHKPFHFPPMSSRERRLLHLALAHSGFSTLSEGDPPRRHLVLRPSPD